MIYINVFNSFLRVGHYNRTDMDQRLSKSIPHFIVLLRYYYTARQTTSCHVIGYIPYKYIRFINVYYLFICVNIGNIDSCIVSSTMILVLKYIMISTSKTSLELKGRESFICYEPDYDVFLFNLGEHWPMKNRFPPGTRSKIL